MADLKQLARRIFHETLAAIDIPETMQRKLRREGTVLASERYGGGSACICENVRGGHRQGGARDGGGLRKLLGGDVSI